MNEIIIVPKEINYTIEFEGIEFSKCTFIGIYIDGVSIEELNDFESGVVYWEEFLKSCAQSGNYLLFTCYCGIPEDSGWDYIAVTHAGDNIEWRLNRDQDTQYVFNKVDFLEQIESCKKLLDLKQFPLAVEVSEMPSY